MTDRRYAGWRNTGRYPDKLVMTEMTVIDTVSAVIMTK